MNFIMGFLLFLMEDEEQTFKFFVTLTEKRLWTLFSDNHEKLKQHFYLVDRIIEIYCPEIYQHLSVIFVHYGK